MSIERHALTRTSPKGDSFFGTCTKCGKRNVTIVDSMTKVCPNTKGKTQDESLMEAITG